MNAPSSSKKDVEIRHTAALQVVGGMQLAHSRPLRPDEAALFAQCEAQIRDSLYGFLEMGTALLTISKHELHRQSHASFDEYCRDRWQIGRAYAYRLIAAAEVVSTVLTRGDIVPPQMEAQVRPLVGLDRSIAVRVWHRVVTEAKGKPITSRMVKQVVAELAPPKETPKRPARRQKRSRNLREILKLIDKAKLFIERGYQDDALRALQTIECFLESLPQETLSLVSIPDDEDRQHQID